MHLIILPATLFTLGCYKSRYSQRTRYSYCSTYTTWSRLLKLDWKDNMKHVPLDSGRAHSTLFSDQWMYLPQDKHVVQISIYLFTNPHIFHLHFICSSSTIYCILFICSLHYLCMGWLYSCMTWFACIARTAYKTRFFSLSHDTWQ